jgi:hypothetical protein
MINRHDLPAPHDDNAIASLHDVEAAAGDEQEVRDLFTLDVVEARELSIDLDPVDDEPELD